ncbi:MAG: NTP transferase domain-containing protein [Muribaculaceae bacterium]|nr:NTP transferase domain-containing protein [Muribaculaceae bacterium]
MNDKHILSHRSTLIEALDRLNSLSGGIMTLMITDDNGVLTGTLTDGDVRRALLSGATLDTRVESVMHRQFKSMPADGVDVDALRELRRAGIRLLPLLNSDGSIARLLDLSGGRSLLPVSAVLMAGGRGERLRPLTDTTPKPLLTIDGKAIIDYNIEALARAGINDITVTTSYLADKLHEHFAEPVAGVSVRCVTEERPLGTIGSLALVNRTAPDGTTLVMNSDLLTTISFEEMYLTHLSRCADITIAVLPYTVSVPYAILCTDPDSDRVTAIEEKPTYSYYANAGIYMISNRLLDEFVTGQHIDATDLVARAIDRGNTVTYYPINGTWIDVGTPTDFRQAEELMRHLRNFSQS